MDLNETKTEYDDDAADQLLEVDAVANDYDANGDGIRVSKTVSGVATSYVWDVGAQLPEVLQETTAGETTYYVYGLGLISTIEGSTDTYYLKDGLGSTVNLTNDSGVKTDSYTYDPFGIELSHTFHSPATAISTQPFEFTGQQRDVGLAKPAGASQKDSPYYLRARYYDPGLGRFWSRDPLPLMNQYAYVGNNPINLVDPSGYLFDLPCPGCDAVGDRIGDAYECFGNRGNCVTEAVTEAIECLGDTYCRTIVVDSIGLGASIVATATCPSFIFAPPATPVVATVCFVSVGVGTGSSLFNTYVNGPYDRESPDPLLALCSGLPFAGPICQGISLDRDLNRDTGSPKRE